MLINDDEDRLHSGIAVVVPAMKILEVLSSDQFVKRRKQIELSYKNSLLIKTRDTEKSGH